MTFAKNTVGGGTVSDNCPAVGELDGRGDIWPGCGGAGGDGGTGKTAGKDGKPGSNGKPGTATAPNSNVTATGLAPMKVTTTKLPSGEVGASYHASLAAKGGIPPYKWTATGLPKGLKLSTAGAISGKPAEAGTYSVTVSVTDPAGAERTTGMARFSLAVKGAKKPKR